MTQIKIKDKSEMSRQDYIVLSVEIILLICGIHSILYFIIPKIKTTNCSLPLMVLCLIASFMFGTLASWKYNRNLNGIVNDTVTGLGVYIFITVAQTLPPSIHIICLLFFIVVTMFKVMVDLSPFSKKTTKVKDALLRRVLAFKIVQSVRESAGVVSVAIILMFISVLAINAKTNYNIKRDAAYGKFYYESFEIHETYGEEYSLENNYDTLKLICDNDTFQSLSYDEKCNVIEKLVQYSAFCQGVSEVNIEFRELESNSVCGQYNHLNKTVTINKNIIENGNLPGGSNMDVIVTCFHEVHHYYIHSICEIYISLTPEQRNLMLFTQYNVAEWGKSLVDYKIYETGDREGYIEYFSQEVERECRRYSEEKAEKFIEDMKEITRIRKLG